MSDEIDMNRDAAPTPDLPMTLDAMGNDRRSAMLRQLIAPHTITQSSPDVPRQAMPDMVMLAYIKESTGQTTQQVLEWASRNNVTQSPIEAGPFGRPQFGASQLPPINVQMLDKYVNSFHWRNLRESVDSTVTPEYRRQLGLDPLPQRRNGIIPEGIEHATNTSEVTATLLEHNQGIAFADEHSDYASVEDLTKHINTLREQGVKVLFIEMVRSNFQDSLDAYMQTGDPNTPDNNGYTLDKGGLNQRWDNYAPGQRQNYFDLIETARAAGMEVVGIDTVDANGERFITSNQHWADVVSARAATLGPNERYAVFGGRDHFAKGVDTGEYTGQSVTDILNIPTVELTSDPEHAGKISTQVGMHDAKYVRVSLPQSPRQLQIGDIADYETPPLQKRVPPVLVAQKIQFTAEDYLKVMHAGRAVVDGQGAGLDPEILAKKVLYATSIIQERAASGAPIEWKEAVVTAEAMMNSVRHPGGPAGAIDMLNQKMPRRIAEARIEFLDAQADNAIHGEWKTFADTPGWAQYANNSPGQLSNFTAAADSPSLGMSDVNSLVYDALSAETGLLYSVRGRTASGEERRRISTDFETALRSELANASPEEVPKILARFQDNTNVRVAVDDALMRTQDIMRSQGVELDAQALFKPLQAQVDAAQARGMPLSEIATKMNEVATHQLAQLRASMDAQAPTVEAAVQGELRALAKKIGVSPETAGQIQVRMAETGFAQLGMTEDGGFIRGPDMLPSDLGPHASALYFGHDVRVAGSNTVEAQKLLGAYREQLADRGVEGISARGNTLQINVQNPAAIAPVLAQHSAPAALVPPVPESTTHTVSVPSDMRAGQLMPSADTAPRPALSAEPAGWLARDLTWGAATQDHLSHWFKEVNYNAWHDPSHVILALSGMPKFQATFDAEIHALTLDDALARPNPESNFDPSVLATEEGYRASVKNVAEIFGAEENLTRTLLWSMAGESGQTTDDLYRSYDHDRSELRFDAKNHGIIMDAEYNGARETISAWKIRLPNGSHYTFDSIDPSKTNLPSGSNGVEDFTPFRAPSDEQISNIFRRVEPILKDLQPQIAAAAAADPSGNKAEWLSGIKVRDMHARMYGGTDAPLTISAAVPRVSAILDAPELSAKPGTDSAAPLAAEIEKRNIQTDPETGKKIYTPRNGEDVSAAVARARIYANASGEDVTATHNRATFTITPGMTQEEGLAGWQADKAFRASPEFRDSPVGIEERNISRHPVTGKLTYTPSPGEHIDDSARRAQIFVNDSGKQVIVNHSYGRSVVAPVAALNAATPDSRAPAADASPVDALRPVSTPELPRATAVEMSATELDAARKAAAGDKLLGRAGTKLPPGAIRMQNLMRQAAQNGAAAGASPNTETPSSTPDAVPSASPATASAEVAHAAPVAPPTPTPATAPVPVPAPSPVAPTTPSSGNTAQTSTPSTTTVAVEAAVAATIVTSAQADSVTPPLTEPTHSKAMNKGMSGLGLGMATNMVKEINRKLEAGETVSVEEYVAAGVNMGSGALDLAGKGLDSLAGAKMGAIKGGALVQTALALPMILAAARTGDSTQIGAVSVGAVSGIGFGLAGQTFIPIPGVGFVIGVVAGEAGAKLGGLATTAMLNDDPAMRAQAQNELKNLAIEYGTPPGVGLNLAGAAVSSVGRAVNTLGQVSTWLGDKVDDLNALTGRNLVTGPVLGGASLVLKGTGVVVSGLGNAVDAVGQASEAVGHGVNRATKEMIRGVGSAVNHFGQSLTQEYQRDPTVRGALKATVVASADVVQRTVDYAERRLQETGQAVVNAVSNAQSWYANNAPSWLGGKGEKTPEKHPTPHPSYNAQITGLIAEAKAKGRAGELDANHDGTFDMNDIRANLKKTGMKLDANQDGIITGGEFIRAQTTPAKPAQPAAVQSQR